MATVYVDIVWDYDPNIQYVELQYKKQQDTEWTKPTSPQNPTIETKYPLALEEMIYYDVKLTATAKGGCTPLPVIYEFVVNPNAHTTTTTTTSTTTTTTTSTTTTTTTTIYVPPVQEEFVNLSSPYTVMTNDSSGMIYFTDYDDNVNSLYYFDPSTAQDKSDFVAVDQSNIGAMRLHAAVYNTNNNKIYTHGVYSNGLLIIDCNTNTVEKTIQYSVNSLYYRQRIFLIGDIVYAYTLSGNKFIRVDTLTDTEITSFVPGGSGVYSSNTLVDTEDKLWVLQFGVDGSSRAISYDKSDVTTIVDIVPNIGNTNDATGKTNIGLTWYDPDTKEIWFCSTGDAKIGVIDTTTATLTHQIPVDKGDRSYVYGNAMYYEKDNILYFTGKQINDQFDPGNPVTYKIDRGNHKVEGMSEKSYSPPLVFDQSTGNTYGAVRGLVQENSPNTGYDTDGKIVVYG